MNQELQELQVFPSEQFGQVRVIEKNGEPWFVATDIYRALEHSNSHMALERLDDEKGVSSFYTPGGAQEMQIVKMQSIIPLCVKLCQIVVIHTFRNA